MPENKDRGASWDTDSMIWNAKSLQRVVKELDHNGAKSPQSDLFLFSGVFLASPILLSLAIEIALKAWQCQERKGTPDRTHDLLKLFDSLEPSSKKLLEDGMRSVEPFTIEDLIEEGMRSFEPLRKNLRSHKDAHEHWRYIYEKHGGIFQTATLNRALTVIIDAYDKRWGDSA